MDKEIIVDNWAQFLLCIDYFKNFRLKDEKLYQRLLFRGQNDADWPLETTLERYEGAPREFAEYYRRIAVLQPQIETLTQTKWQIETVEYVYDLTSRYDSFSRAMSFGQMPAYGYMAYLRHHGFPSPLLDWTRSPYAAAYFALNRDLKNNYAAVYVLLEANTKSGSSRKPKVVNLGNHVATHKRHFLQQSEYTMCLSYGEDSWRFASHEGNFEDWRDQEYADNFSVHKIKIPAKERTNFLRALDDFNMNAFSLFGTEDSLMETLALRELQITAGNL